MGIKKEEGMLYFPGCDDEEEGNNLCLCFTSCVDPVLVNLVMILEIKIRQQMTMIYGDTIYVIYYSTMHQVQWLLHSPKMTLRDSNTN